jgi:predicted membrane channel-forming protein YqfA (hemolysin III family)
MKGKDLNEFPWQTMFFVTGLSFIFFSLALKFLDGTHSVPMLWVGTVSLLSGAVSWVIEIVTRRPVRKNRKHIS